MRSLMSSCMHMTIAERRMWIGTTASIMHAARSEQQA